jgi:hypothetical protein
MHIIPFSELSSIRSIVAHEGSSIKDHSVAYLKIAKCWPPVELEVTMVCKKINEIKITLIGGKGNFSKII